jgi:lipopolysaccharide/colanic/teichoic acid biosynthesis glycosyltransferase
MITNSQHAEAIYDSAAFAQRTMPFRSIWSTYANGSISQTTADIKRAFDIVFSLSVLILGAPVYLAVMLITKITSRGPVFYKQERVGENGKPFFIYKFRSMKIDAEKYGPQLATGNDPRVTKWGRIMRKTHLDEIPQFFNVLIGDMSIVGPRPERAHYIEQIVARTPDYRKLQSIKPGITSIGQVSFGYAESVDEMCERMKLDLAYLMNINLWNDLSIIGKTVTTMVLGKGQ